MLFVLEKITSEKSTLAKELLSLMGLDKKEHQNALTLSAGEKQRLCLARAIITDPEILLLDEPLAGVNPKLAEEILEIILNLSKNGISILMVEHNLSLIHI